MDINEKRLQESVDLAGNLKEAVSNAHVVNITDREAVAALPQKIIAAHGAVDGLINCAGIIQKFVRVNDLSFDEINRVMNVNFYGMV